MPILSLADAKVDFNPAEQLLCLLIEDTYYMRKRLLISDLKPDHSRDLTLQLRNRHFDSACWQDDQELTCEWRNLVSQKRLRVDISQYENFYRRDPFKEQYRFLGYKMYGELTGFGFGAKEMVCLQILDRYEHIEALLIGSNWKREGPY